MDKIESFCINHLKLYKGLYLSRKDTFNGTVISTFDLRMTAPNREPPIDVSALHTIEHLFATYLRNSASKDRIVYFGPMGCRTGFYLLVRDLDNETVLRETKKVLELIANHQGAMFGASRKECGNYRELSVESAKAEATRYLAALNSREQTFEYPKA